MIAQYLADSGAKHLILLSRSGRKSADEPFLQCMEDQGIQVDALACDVSKFDDVESALTSVIALPHIKGCIHAAVVMEVR